MIWSQRALHTTTARNTWNSDIVEQLRQARRNRPGLHRRAKVHTRHPLRRRPASAAAALWGSPAPEELGNRPGLPVLRHAILVLAPTLDIDI